MIRALQHCCYGLIVDQHCSRFEMSAICRCGQRGKGIDMLTRHCTGCLVILEQQWRLHSYTDITNKTVSDKLVSKQQKIIYWIFLCITLTASFSSCRPMSNLLQILSLTQNNPLFNICLHSKQLSSPYVWSQWPRLKLPSPVSIIWNCTSGICHTHVPVACCHNGTLVH